MCSSECRNRCVSLELRRDGAVFTTVDLEERYEGMAPDPWEPPTWHARIALGTETVTDLDLG